MELHNNLLVFNKLCRSEVVWSPQEDGIGNSTHEDYLKEFGDNFLTAMINLVDRAMVDQNQLSQNDLYLEVLQVIRSSFIPL